MYYLTFSQIYDIIYKRIFRDKIVEDNVRRDRWYYRSKFYNELNSKAREEERKLRNKLIQDRNCTSCDKWNKDNYCCSANKFSSELRCVKESEDWEI